MKKKTRMKKPSTGTNDRYKAQKKPATGMQAATENIRKRIKVRK